MNSNPKVSAADRVEAHGRRSPIEAADGTPDGGHRTPLALGLDLLDPATWQSLAIPANHRVLA